MGWTKQQLIEDAFAEIGLPVSTFNVGPDQMERALRGLDNMMAAWNAKGIRLGYAMSSSPGNGDLADQSGLPDSAYEAVVKSLAMRIAPSRGKTVSQDTRIAARDAYEGLLSLATFPPQQQMPNTLPRGAGNKPWRFNTPFMPTPVDPLLAAEGGDQIEFE